MNTKYLSLVAAVALVSTHAFADEVFSSRHGREEQRNILLFNPGDLFSGVISLEYERALAPFFGLAFGGLAPKRPGVALLRRRRGHGAVVDS